MFRPEDWIFPTGMIIERVSYKGKKPKIESYAVATDYGEFNLPKEFGKAKPHQKIAMVTKAVVGGMNEYWNG